MPPVSECDPGMMDSLGYNFQLKLDLHNFEDPRYEDSKYVLTSPRSLEACSRMQIKPVELLYKPLAEFQEELLPQDVPLRTIFNIYDDHEQDRQRRLRRCREERRGIVEEDADRDESTVTVTRHSNRDTHGVDTEGSAQRERTKWVSSIGHQRVSRQELNQRAKKLYEESMKAKPMVSSRSTRHKKRSKKGGNSISRARSASCDRIPKHSSINASCTSHQGPDSRPITNPKLRKTLKETGMVHAEIPQKDQKILELMIAKGEEEKSFYEGRQAAKLSWSEERRRQMESQNEAENRRRRQLDHDRRQWESQREELLAERSRLDETLREERRRTIDSKLQHSQTLVDQSYTSKILQIEEKKMRESLRKKSQEENRGALAEEEGEMRELVRERQRQELEEAWGRKETKISQDSERRRLENSQRLEEHHRRRKHLESANSLETENLRSSINGKHSKALANHEEMVNRRDLQLCLSQREREKKQYLVKLNQKQLDSEMEDWRQSLNQYRQSLEGRASEAANRTVQLKVEKAARDRRDKERLQKVNIKKVAQDLESWRRSTQDLLEEKQRKAEDIQSERESTIQQTRAMAHAAECMRDKLKQKYAKDSFDKKAQQAEIFNKLGLGLLGKTDFGKHRPHVKFADSK